ncbi:hypothetical protein VTN49DRAFT_7773 [Thermomyces lanuginosus]|uniref:uncharacterized protein n=1 Tax=Thermomyces lanuginosus TaxID=5541 RepID=UPI003744A573
MERRGVTDVTAWDPAKASLSRNRQIPTRRRERRISSSPAEENISGQRRSRVIYEKRRGTKGQKWQEQRKREGVKREGAGVEVEQVRLGYLSHGLANLRRAVIL